MFERFTDRARRVVVLAQEEARLLPTRSEVDHFLDDVDQLRSDLDRLNARIERLLQTRDNEP